MGRSLEKGGGDSFIPIRLTEEAEGPDPPRVLMLDMHNLELGASCPIVGGCYRVGGQGN